MRSSQRRTMLRLRPPIGTKVCPPGTWPSRSLAVGQPLALDFLGDLGFQAWHPDKLSPAPGRLYKGTMSRDAGEGLLAGEGGIDAPFVQYEQRGLRLEALGFQGAEGGEIVHARPERVAGDGFDAGGVLSRLYCPIACRYMSR
ncbi:MAG: hypothetical protein ACHP7P_14380 [Terriglobales bacterium]